MSYICAYHKTKEKTQVLLCEEFRSPVVNKDSKIYELVGGSSDDLSEDELQTAANEFEEEAGLKLKKSRFRKVDIKQSSATLCSHRITLYAVELTDEEMKHFKNDNDIHGVVEETEQIHLHMMDLNKALKMVDWTNAGMIMAAVKG
jgi:8-oxo-dGTP pyrophosphatase MutT (NUDIX family)